MESSFVIGLAVDLPQSADLARRDRRASDAVRSLLDITDMALEHSGCGTKRLLVSVSPFGPLLAFLDPSPARLEAFLRSLQTLFTHGARTPGVLRIRGAICHGSIRRVQVSSGGKNFEGEPAIVVARLLAHTEPGSLTYQQDVTEFWQVPPPTDAAPICVLGKQNEKYWARIARSYFPTSPAPPAVSQRKFLRRRCRVLPPRSQELRRIFTALLSEGPSTEEREAALDRVLALDDAPSKYLGKALYLEAEGDIEQMLAELERAASHGEAECCRRLMRALALDKLDSCEAALEDLTFVLLRAPHHSDLIIAAQFNAAVCHEKLDRFDLVDVDRFLADKTLSLSTGELVWLKAVSLALIVATKSGTKFKYEALVPEALAAEAALAPKGYVKTLLNWHTYTGEGLTAEELAQVVTLQAHMSATARASVLGKLVQTLPPGPTRTSIQELHDSLIGAKKSYAVRKWNPHLS